MNIPLLIETIRFLRPLQVIYQLKHRLFHPKMKAVVSPVIAHSMKIIAPIAKYSCYDGIGQFSFLNSSSSFEGWDMKTHDPLWTYNLNYMDWLEQENITAEECLKWIDKFIDELSDNHSGQDPYPTALRIINWAKFFCKHPECRSKRRLDSMYSQTLLLERKLEYHLLGNHLLEDSYALTIAAIFFADEHIFRKSTQLLINQLDEQLLSDGAHYEQSPMYHCILLDRLLDCINFSVNNQLFANQETFNSSLKIKAAFMLGHMQSIIYSDGSIPLLNDSAYNIAPTSSQLFDYAQRLGISWKPISLKECGYRKMKNCGIEVVLDIGNIAASYQPGHSHADTLSYELRIDGQPIVVDTGISTYNKNKRRQYERSTAAHNTVTVDGKNSSHVWGGFRVGMRAKVTIEKEAPLEIIAHHNGFGHNAIHQRRFFLMNNNSLRIEDNIIGKEVEAVSYTHFNPQLHAEIINEADGIIKVGDHVIKVEGFRSLLITQEKTSTKYNVLQQCDVLAVTFTQQLKIEIKRKVLSNPLLDTL